jgi:hypothetical protein
MPRAISALTPLQQRFRFQSGFAADVETLHHFSQSEFRHLQVIGGLLDASIVQVEHFAHNPARQVVCQLAEIE